ncbi:MAG: hypothetical protein K6G25_05100 [Bacteroidales bacterium]|nr:hypothetical protein [Bacteroidales bacterium]
MKRMNKKIMILMSALMLMVGSLKAQVFIMDDEFEGQLRQNEGEYVLIVPVQGATDDQYVPLGEGVLALAALGGAYLLAKRRRETGEL